MNTNKNTESNTNNKENNTMNTTDITADIVEHKEWVRQMPCVAVTDQLSKCMSHPRFEVNVLYRTTTAYLPEALPATHQGGGFLGRRICVCGTHVNVLKGGNALRIRNLDDSNSELPTFPINNTSKEDDMNNTEERYDGPMPGDIASDGTPYTVNSFTSGEDPDAHFDGLYDVEHSQKEQLKFLEGRPFDIHPLKDGGKVMVERCDHDDCQDQLPELFFEMDNEECCGEENCGHFFHILCLHHGETKYPGCIRENRVHETNTVGRVKEWHKTREYAMAHINLLKDGEFGGIALFTAKKSGLWVYWNIDPELNNQGGVLQEYVAPTKTMTIKTKRPKCGNCVKNGVEDPYHDTPAEVKACYRSK